MSESTKNPLNAFLEGAEDTAATDFFADMTFPEPDPIPAQAPNPQPAAPAPAEAPAQTATPQSVPASAPQPSAYEQALAQTPAADPTPQPIAAPVSVPQPAPETAPAQMTLLGAEAPAAPNTFEEAYAKAKAQSDGRLVEALAAKHAVFNYSKAKDTITDLDCTFEDLRAKYEGDFPELSDADKVTWSVTYGKVTKSISKPSSDKVYEIKAEIEKSKSFVDAIKKAKTDAEKSPECVVKPRIKPQSKGEVLALPDYKGYCTSVEDALKSEKSIVILPSKDGRLYQMRKTPVGVFTAPADHLPEFAQVRSGFQMALPKIPMQVLMSVINFFEALSEKYELEALVHILYDTQSGEYITAVPKQEITHVSVNAVTEEEYPEHLIHVMDIHSHNTMSAKFSPVDDADEKATRLYAVVGRLDRTFPDITVRASCGGQFILLQPEEVFDINFKSYTYPEDWHERITIKNTGELAEHIAEKKAFFPKAFPKYRIQRIGGKR